MFYMIADTATEESLSDAYAQAILCPEQPPADTELLQEALATVIEQEKRIAQLQATVGVLKARIAVLGGSRAPKRKAGTGH